MPNSLTKGLRPIHPGELLREDVLPALGRPKAEIAALLGISRQHLYDLMRERKGVTPAMALRIGKLTGTTPESWLDMQRNYDLAKAQEQLGRALDDIPTLSAA